MVLMPVLIVLPYRIPGRCVSSSAHFSQGTLEMGLALIVTS